MISKTKLKKIYDFYRSGKTIKETGEKFNMSKQAVHKLFQYHNFQISKRWNNKGLLNFNKISDKSKKECIICNKVKPLSEFYKNNDGKNYQSSCKDCNYLRLKKWNLLKKITIKETFMQTEREVLNKATGEMESKFDPPEPFNQNKMLKTLKEKAVKAVHVFDQKKLPERMKLLSKGQRRKHQKKWDEYKKTGIWKE